jgi:predicted lipoprotein with Yx(FWY)xxD motif
MTASRSRFSRLAAIAVIGLLAAACASGAGSSGATQTPGATAAAGSPTIGMATSASLGAYLTGPNGLTLYIKTSDSANTSTCSGDCLAAWPPLTVTAGQVPVAGTGVTGSLGTFTRADGSTQVTYNGLPLYYWVSDTKAGDTTGQGVGGFVVAAVAGTTPPGGAPSPSDEGKGSY